MDLKKARKEGNLEAFIQEREKEEGIKEKFDAFLSWVMCKTRLKDAEASSQGSDES